MKTKIRCIGRYISVLFLVLCLLSQGLIVSYGAVDEENGLLYIKQEEGVTIVGRISGSDVLIIPETIGGSPVVAIGEGAFANTSTITQVILPPTVTTIEKEAFLRCDNLTTIQFSTW